VLYIVGYKCVFALVVGRRWAAARLRHHGLNDSRSLFAINCGIALVFLLITFLLLTTPIESSPRRK